MGEAVVPTDLFNSGTHVEVPGGGDARLSGTRKIKSSSSKEGIYTPRAMK